ncbi:hypothetical protein [Rufibacter sp. LB8]|uniref:hypothetical protein n=1 Tax=Rufibacter sp. LB8 TaxID=2777781 RepID=UPI00178C1E8F|nr:hypothetical protein [Rufibacter sp. LB8]
MPAGNSTYKKLAVQWLNEALCFVSSLVLADSFVLRNRQLLVAANRWQKLNLKIMKNILYLLIVAFLLQGCFTRDESMVNIPCKQNCVTFNITVNTGQGSQTPVPGASVELGWNSPATPIGNPGRLISKGSTDEKGRYTFSFSPTARELEEGQYYISVKKDNSYHYQFDSHYGINKTDTTVTANVHLPSKATVKVVFKNFSPNSSDDFFQAIPLINTYGSGGIPVEQISSNHNYWFYGSDPPFAKYEVSGITAGNQYTQFMILIKKNGQRISRRDSIYIKKGEVGTFELEY